MTTNGATYFVYHTPHGPLSIRASKKGITHVVFGDVRLFGIRHPSELTTRTANEILEYLAGKRMVFDVPLDVQGSAFQRAVWNELTHIPYAETSSATDIAARIGKPTSYRAVGVAIQKNPVAIIIPDHRIVTTKGYMPGKGNISQVRRALLAMEQRRLITDTP